MRVAYLHTSIICMLVCVGLTGYSQSITVEDSSSEPDIEYISQLAKARFFLRSDNPERALEKYLELQAIYGLRPEVLLGLGNAYHVLGSVELSVVHYERLLEDNYSSNQLDYTAVRYRLAHYYFYKKMLRKYEDSLEIIIRKKNLHDLAMTPLYSDEGLDAFLAIYDIEFDFSFYAYRELGLYEILVKKRLDRGLSYLLTALSMLFNELGLAVLAKDIDYVFTDSVFLAEKVRKEADLLEYLQRIEAGRLLNAILRYTEDKSLEKESKVILELLRKFKLSTDANSSYLAIFP